MFSLPKEARLPLTYEDQRIAMRFRKYGLWMALLCIAAVALTLVPGWVIGVPVLLQIFDGYPVMVPETALCLLVGGVGAALCHWSGYRTAKLLCGVAILLLVFVAHVIQPFSRISNRADAMSLATTLCNLLLAATLLARAMTGARFGMISTLCATLGLSVAAISVLGYIFSAEVLFLNEIYTEIALQTAISLVALFLSLLMTAPTVGWMSVLTAPERGSEMARKILPIVIIGPILLCSVALYAAMQDLVTADLRAAILTYMMICTTVSAAIYFAHLTNLSERRAYLSNALLRDSERARQATELAVVRTQKVEALGNLVGGVAHDFNNTLTVILGNLELIGEDEDESQRAKYIREAISASNQAAQLTRQLLAYGRKSRLEPLPSRLDDLIETTLTMFRRICPANISLQTDLASPGAIIEVDVANMQQALLNILINARDAQPHGGWILISSQVEHLAKETVLGFSEGEALPDGSYVTVSVRDRGPGMPPDILARAAEPFFTTKDVGDGTGLGLSVVSGFCRQSGGGMTLSSELGQGLTVSMVFPLVSQPDQPAELTSQMRNREAAGGSDILVVDDEVQVTRILARQLQLDGHHVTIAKSAEQALLVLAADPLPDLVLSDLSMPGEMQGDALALTLLQNYPSVRIILMSGYQSDRTLRKSPAIRNLAFLQKPIDRIQLRAAVQEALSRRGSSGALDTADV